MRVVAWYLPSFANVVRDLRRSLAAVRFRSPKRRVRSTRSRWTSRPRSCNSASKRTARLLALVARRCAQRSARATRSARSSPSPRGMELQPEVLARLPVRGAGEAVRRLHADGLLHVPVQDRGGARDYTEANVELIRAAGRRRGRRGARRRRARGQRNGRARCALRVGSSGRGRDRREPVRLRDHERRPQPTSRAWLSGLICSELDADQVFGGQRTSAVARRGPSASAIDRSSDTTSPHRSGRRSNAPPGERSTVFPVSLLAGCGSVRASSLGSARARAAHPPDESGLMRGEELNVLVGSGRQNHGHGWTSVSAPPRSLELSTA